jgi:TATA-box binding protein (TBP) (component of TFIID and TFIIIB)
MTSNGSGIEKLRLRDLALATSNCEYIPGQGLLMRTVNPPTAACIQRDGSMIVMGARTFEDSR